MKTEQWRRNRGFRRFNEPGPPSSWDPRVVGPQKNLGKTLRKIIKLVATLQMTDFKAKIHQIRFRLGLRPRPRWGSLQHSRRPPSWIWEPIRGRGEGLGWGTGGKGRGTGGMGKWKGGKGRAPKLLLNQGPSEPCYATAARFKRAFSQNEN